MDLGFRFFVVDKIDDKYGIVDLEDNVIEYYKGRNVIHMAKSIDIMGVKGGKINLNWFYSWYLKMLVLHSLDEMIEATDVGYIENDFRLYISDVNAVKPFVYFITSCNCIYEGAYNYTVSEEKYINVIAMNKLFFRYKDLVFRNMEKEGVVELGFLPWDMFYSVDINWYISSLIRSSTRKICLEFKSIKRHIKMVDKPWIDFNKFSNIQFFIYLSAGSYDIKSISRYIGVDNCKLVFQSESFTYLNVYKDFMDNEVELNKLSNIFMTRGVNIRFTTDDHSFLHLKYIVQFYRNSGLNRFVYSIDNDCYSCNILEINPYGTAYEVTSENTFFIVKSSDYKGDIDFSKIKIYITNAIHKKLKYECMYYSKDLFKCLHGVYYDDIKSSLSVIKE